MLVLVVFVKDLTLLVLVTLLVLAIYACYLSRPDPVVCAWFGFDSRGDSVFPL